MLLFWFTDILFMGSADFCHRIHIIYRHEMGAVGVDVS